MSRDTPRLFTIPASVPFLPVLADALLDGRLVEGFAPRHDPLALATATVFLPTRRAGRLFGEALLAAMGGQVTLLPRIVPLGDVDEDALAFADAFTEPPEAVPSTTRRLALASLVGKWRDVLRAGDARAAVAAGPGAELALADALAHLIDEMAAQNVPWSKLDTLVPGEHDLYWDMALDFLKIAREVWPALLAEMNAVDGSIRRDRLIAAEAARLTALGANADPVIAAGSTGSMPTTALLLTAVARLPRGCVVLPGLDRHLDAAAWAALTTEKDPSPSHPQYGLAHLLARMGVGREAVMALAHEVPQPRDVLLSEALRPAGTTEAWASLDQRLPDGTLEAALADVTVIEADDAREEAITIAIALREVLDAPGRTGALVTPDRDLARRVAAELLRFGVRIDDSAGEPLSESASGRLARLVADAAAQALAPIPLAALLRHPGTRLGLDETALAHATDALELIVLRGPRLASGAEGLDAAVAAFDAGGHHRSDPRAGIDATARARAVDLAARIGQALAPLLDLGVGRHAFADLVAGHRAAMQMVRQAVRQGFATGGGTADTELEAAFEAFAKGAPYAPAMTLDDYAAALPTLLADRPVRPGLEAGARLRILGPLEARLVSVDRMVLAGLVEESWPASVRSDPWLSRPMRAALKLDAPERRIGLSAHDFAQACGAPELILSRSAKLGGAPTVPSRFLQRLAAVSGEERWKAAIARGDRLRRVGKLFDLDAPAARISRPAPTPEVALRPVRLSVTEIETWLRDPYSIYARHILGLRPLDGFDETPGGAERGSAIHEALGEFAKAYPEGLPEAAEALLLDFGRRAFAHLEVFPAEHAIWWARFRHLAGWYVAWEKNRRPDLRRVIAESGGRFELPGTRGPFTLTGRADRIEVQREGGLAILDFKTGAVPTAKQTSAVYSPQLPLEAAMAAQGAFRDVPATLSADLLYVRLRTGYPPIEEKSVVEKNTSAAELATITLERLETLVRAFENQAQGYAALRRPMFRGRFGDYDHLARVKEWSVGGEEGGE